MKQNTQKFKSNLLATLPSTISFLNFKNLERIFFLCLICTFNACREKEFTSIATLPEDDLLNALHFSYNGAKSYTLLEDDSLLIDERPFSLLGSYIDPVFGKCEAGFTTQFTLSELSPDFTKGGSTPIIDSVVLSIEYSDAYGDIKKLNGQQTVEVFELIKDTKVADTVYASSVSIDTFFVASNKIGSKTFLPDLVSSVKVDTIYENPQLRIQLDKTLFAKKIMGLSPFNNEALKSDDEFKKYFKGLYVRVNNPTQAVNQGGIISFNLLGSASKITTYFHNDSIPKGKFDYKINGAECARLNIFKHEYSNAPLIQAQLSNPALGQQQIYVQALAGLRSKIEIPVIKQLIDSGPIAIHKAEIIFKIVEPLTGKYVPSSRLFLSGIDISGNRVILPDVFEISAFSGDYYGGTYDADKNEYRFNIARYVQQVIRKNYTDYGFYLQTASPSTTANRVVLQGGSNIQFNLTYTKL